MTCQIIRAEGYKPTVVKYVKVASPETLQIKISGVLKRHSRQREAVRADTSEEAIKRIEAGFGSY